MKKTILLAALPLALVLSSCGGGGPEADADKMCNMMKDWKKAKDAGNEEEADKIREEGKKFEEELKAKYEKDEAGMKVLDEKMDACEKEM